jgi:hypothetical protein
MNDMSTTELELLTIRDPNCAGFEILKAFIDARPGGLTTAEAGFVVEARLRATTEPELDMLLTIEQRERLRVIVQLGLTGTTAPEETLLDSDSYLAVWRLQ